MIAVKQKKELRFTKNHHSIIRYCDINDQITTYRTQVFVIKNKKDDLIPNFFHKIVSFWLGLMVAPIIQAIGRPEFEDGLRPKSSEYRRGYIKCLDYRF